MRYIVYDSMMQPIRWFTTYKAASEYKFVFGNYGWTIKQVK